MVVTHNAESKNEEIWNKVRARAAVTTDSGEGTTELGLMAALARAGQSSSPASAPEREAVGGDRQIGVLLATPAPIMARLVLDRLQQPYRPSCRDYNT